MSVVKSVGNKNGGGRGKIKSISHCAKTIDYIRQEKKAYKVDYINCCDGATSQLVNELQNVRKVHDKDSGIICHHYTLSFPPEEKITPEQVHRFALEFARKAWSDYQVVIATHTDREHLHAHFIVNNVSLVNGKKFPDNKKSLSKLQALNDQLCKKYNYSIVGLDYENKKYKGINAATREAAKRKKSWKVELAVVLQAAIKNPKITNQKSFTEFLQSKNFQINYSGKNITVKKEGEKKCIRLNTLAKEAGEIFEQDNIVKRFKIDHELISDELKIKCAAVENRNQKNIIIQSQKAESEYFDSHPPQYNSVRVPIILKQSKALSQSFSMAQNQQNKSRINSAGIISRIVIAILHLLLFSRNRKIFRSRYSFEKKKYKIYRNLSEEKKYNTSTHVGNVSFQQLNSLPGENVKIRIYAHQLPLLCNKEFFYCAKVNYSTGTAEVTIKKHNIEKLALTLGVRANYFSGVVEEKGNSLKYKRIKKNGKPGFLILDKAGLQKLKDSYIWNLTDIAVFKKSDDKYNIAFNDNVRSKILNVIYPYKTPEVIRQNKAKNLQLKEIAKKQGVKLCYRVITEVELSEVLKSRDIEFAFFTKEDKFNIVYLPKDREKINSIVSSQSQQKQDVQGIKI